MSNPSDLTNIQYAGQLIDLARREENPDGNPMTAARYYLTASELIASTANSIASMMDHPEQRKFFLFQVKSKLTIYQERVQLLLSVAEQTGLLDKPNLGGGVQAALPASLPPPLFASANKNNYNNNNNNNNNNNYPNNYNHNNNYNSGGGGGGAGAGPSGGGGGGSAVMGIPINNNTACNNNNGGGCSADPPIDAYLKEDSSTDAPPPPPAKSMDELMRDLENLK